MVATSYSVGLIVWSPASQITMWNPTACQIDIAMIEPRAVFVFPSQSIGCQARKVAAPRRLCRSPESPA